MTKWSWCTAALFLGQAYVANAGVRVSNNRTNLCQTCQDKYVCAFLPQIVDGESTMLRARKNKPQQDAPENAKAWALPAHCYEWEGGASDEESTDFDTENEHNQMDSDWSGDEDKDEEVNESAAVATKNTEAGKRGENKSTEKPDAGSNSQHKRKRRTMTIWQMTRECYRR